MEKILLPCRQCIGCRLDHSVMWATRCMHESKSYEENTFITLTYSDEQLPRDKSLCLRHVQLFLKRLRKHIGSKIKVFYCGEYSPPRLKYTRFDVDLEYQDEGRRPHYHALIFGYQFPDQKLWSVRDDIRIYTSDALARLWQYGFSTTGNLTFESAAYVARYSLKKINGKQRNQPDPITGLTHYERIDDYTGQIYEVEQEFAHMSNGIGRDFLHRYMGDIYPHDHCVVNGSELRPPRYYDDIYDSLPGSQLEAIKAKRIERMHKHLADNTPARLRQREKVKEAQVKMLKREAI